MKCGPNHHNACDCREAMFSEMGRKLEALEKENYELKNRDEACRLRSLLVACRSSVKTDLNAYERLLVAKQKHNEQQTPTYIAAEAEAQRLHDLLEKIDAVALTTPNSSSSEATTSDGGGN